MTEKSPQVQLDLSQGDRPSEPDNEEESLPTAIKSAWVNHLANLWNTTTTGLHKLRPIEKLTQGMLKGFSVNEEQIAEILDKIRAELPTTEALLIGKPQAGKSSIVRGLTGVSPDIIGQGFRPHTQYTQRYAYPAQDLPLLIFTDTVGLVMFLMALFGKKRHGTGIV